MNKKAILLPLILLVGASLYAKPSGYSSTPARAVSQSPAKAPAKATYEQPVKGKVIKPSNADSFDAILENNALVVVDFYAEWCGPCQQMHKVIDSLAQDSDLDEIVFVKINIDQQSALSSRYNVSSLPTLIFFADGKQIKKFSGYKDKRALKKIIQDSLL